MITAEQLGWVEQQWKAGFSYTLIGEALKISRSAVAGIVKRHGWQRKNACPTTRLNASAWEQPERVALLKTLHGNGLSSRQIAHRMGISNVEVWRECQRLGLEFVKMVKRPKPRKPRVTPAEARPELKSVPLPAAEPTSATNVTLLARTERQCAWPVGETSSGPDMLMCGAPKAFEVSYCPHHHLKAFSKSGNIGGARPDWRLRPRKRSGLRTVAEGGR